jgi:valyl-tRNA synthetase
MMKGLEVQDFAQPETSNIATKWFSAKLAEESAEVADLLHKYRLSEALMEIYKLYCDEFSGWYLEMIKPAYQQPIDRTTYEQTMQFFDQLLRLLHPFMPFITEELWQNIAERKEGESIMVSELGSIESIENLGILEVIDEVKQIVAGVRNVRASKNIPQKERLTLISEVELNPLVDKLANIENSHDLSAVSSNCAKFIVGTTEYAIPMDAFINVDEELAKLEADLQHQEGFLRGVMAKLGNERFVQNAKPEIVELERKKKADAEQRIAALKANIAELKK